MKVIFQYPTENPATAGVVLLALVGVCSLVLILCAALSNKKLGSRYPPMAKLTVWEVWRLLLDSQLPQKLISIAVDAGSYTFRVPLPLPGAPMVVVIGDGELARMILKDPSTERPHFVGRALEWGFLGPMIVSTHGKEWEHRRLHINPAFSSIHLHRMEHMLQEITEEWITNSFRHWVDQGRLEEVDVTHEILHLSLSIIARAALDYEMDRYEREIWIRELRLIFTEVAFKTIANPLASLLDTFLSSKTKKRASQGCQRLHALSKRIVEHHRELKRPVHGTVIDCIVKNPNYKDDNERASDVSFFIIAGHDTNAYTISFLLRELARHHNIQKVIRQEMFAQPTEENDTGTPGGWQRSKSQTLHHSIKETLRLYPIVGANATRTAGRNFCFRNDDGTTMVVPRGAFTISMAFLTQRNPAVYGDDVHDFRPSRWEKASDAAKMAYIPFSVGKQNCVGQRFAIMAVTGIAGRILSEFELNLKAEGTTEFHISLRPKGLRLNAKRVEKH